MVRLCKLKNQAGEELHPKTCIQQCEGLEDALNDKQPKGDYLTADGLKTINGNSIVGSGDITVNVSGETVESGTYMLPNPVDLSIYAGKTIACVGDSVTYGVGANGNPYVTQLGTNLGTTMINLGVSGTVICTGGHRTCNIDKLTESNLNGADIVTILMGVNDFDQAKEGYYTLGDIDTEDTTTIYGGVKMWCDRIMELKQTESLANTKFYFMTPPITSWNASISATHDWNQDKANIHGYTLRDLCQAIIDVCALYEVPVIDLNLYSGIYYNSADDENATIYGGDGIHPNEAGHTLITEAIIRAFEQNPEYRSETYSIGYILDYVSKALGTELSYPVSVGVKVKAEVPITGITLSETELSLEAGKTYNITVTLTPSNTTQTGLIWESLDDSIAQVSNGLVTAIKEGSTSIVCKSSENNSVSATVNMTVTANSSTELTSLLISDETATVESGQTKTLSVTYAPSNTTQTGVSWESSDSNIATVTPSEDGTTCVVTAVNTGQCYITVKSTVNTSISAQCFFTTSEATSGDSITFTIGTNVTYDSDTQTVSGTDGPQVAIVSEDSGTKYSAIMNEPIAKGMEVELQFVHDTPIEWNLANNLYWSSLVVGLDRQNTVANIPKNNGYGNFLTPDMNVYLDSYESQSNMPDTSNMVAMFQPGGSLARISTGVDIVSNAGFTEQRVIFKRATDGTVTATYNGLTVTWPRSQVTNIAEAEATDDLYLVIDGFGDPSIYQRMKVVYYGTAR